MVDEMKLLAVHLNDRIEQREKLIKELPKDDENLEFSKGALWELIFMAELFEKLYPDFQYPTKTEERGILKHSPHGQPPLSKGDSNPKVEAIDELMFKEKARHRRKMEQLQALRFLSKSEDKNLQGEVGGLEKGD